MTLFWTVNSRVPAQLARRQETYVRPKLTPYGQKIRPSQFPDQNRPVNSHRRQPHAKPLNPAQRRQPQRPVNTTQAPCSALPCHQHSTPSPHKQSRPTHHRLLSTALPSSPTGTARLRVNWVLNRKMHGPGHFKCSDTQTVAICNCC